MAWTGIPQSGLGGRNRNPYAQGGAMFDPSGQHWGFLPAAGAVYDPGIGQHRSLGGVGNNNVYRDSGTQGIGGFFQNEAPQGGYRNPYPNPLEGILQSLGGMDFGFGGGFPGMGGGDGGPFLGQANYTTGIDASPQMTPADQAAAVGRLRNVQAPGPGLGFPLSDAQEATIRRQQQDYARMAGFRAANEFNSTVNQAESGLQMAQDQAKAQVGQESQRFANRVQAHRLNQASAKRQASLGILGDLMSMIGSMV